MSFTAEQRQALTAKLDGRAIRERIQAGQTLSYIEGWYAIAEANRVFGFEGWDRETVSLRCVWEGPRHGRPSCAYIAQVRIRVRAGETVVCRDGHGSGIGMGATPGEAHETAVKEAETDATKRALVTFGNAFGLCLYDKEQKQVRRLRRSARHQGAPTEWPLRSAIGEVVKTYNDPAQFCSALRRALENCAAAKDLTAVWTQHGAALAALQQLPQLKSERGEHYAEILAALYRKRLQELEQRGAANMAGMPLALRPRRVRDKAHLRRVAQQPCLVCGRLPAHAHHLKFLEPRGLGLKPSDAYAVPLCRLHHRALHDVGDEQAWWQQHKIDPVPEAQRLWRGDTPVTSALSLMASSDPPSVPVNLAARIAPAGRQRQFRAWNTTGRFPPKSRFKREAEVLRAWRSTARLRAIPASGYKIPVRLREIPCSGALKLGRSTSKSAENGRSGLKIQPVPLENFPCYLEIGAGKMPVTANPTSSYGLSSWSFDESAPFGSTVFGCDWLLSVAIRAAPPRTVADRYRRPCSAVDLPNRW